MPQLKVPDFIPRPHRRLSGALAEGAVIANATDYSEIIQVAGAAKLRINAKTVTAGGTLKGAFVRPYATDETAIDAKGVIAPAKTTAYDSGNPANVTLTAGTSNHMDVDLHGESYFKVTITGGGAGTIGFVDIALL